MKKLGDYILLNPKENISKGKVARKIAMENLKPFTRDINTWSNISFNGGSKFRNGDTLLARITPCLENGKTAFVNILGDDEIAYGSTEFYVLRAVKNKMDPYYLYYLTISKKFRNTMIKAMTGTSGRQRVPKEAVLEYLMDAPEFEGQKKISKKLKVIDDKITLTNQINDNLIAISKAKWLDLLSSTSTTEVSMNKIAKITMGQSPKSSTYNTNNEGLPLLNGATDFRENINPQRWTSDPKRVVYPNSYIFGVRATIGLTTKVYQKYAIGRGTGAATPINIIYDEFLYFYLEDLFKFYSQTGSGSVYINISKKEFENYKIDVPKISFIEQFHSEINPLFNQIKNNKLQNITLLQIKKDMLNKYFQ